MQRRPDGAPGGRAKFASSASSGGDLFGVCKYSSTFLFFQKVSIGFIGMSDLVEML